MGQMEQIIESSLTDVFKAAVALILFLFSEREN